MQLYIGYGLSANRSLGIYVFLSPKRVILQFALNVGIIIVFGNFVDIGVIDGRLATGRPCLLLVQVLLLLIDTLESSAS